ncbi:TonB family protein [Pontibacter sp. MBLB2868]|uniref:energy transducer TonB n=1 Tax=Pontibacter sp. MBLB2868 TaxID=3451555 RepID=UPI003F755364
MSRDKTQILWEKEDHPSTDLLRQYQQEALPKALQHQLEEHLLDCELCADVVEGMILSDIPKTKAAVRHINQFVTSKTRNKSKHKALPLFMIDWRVAAAIILVMCSMVLVLYYNYREVTHQKGGLVAAETDQEIRKSMDLTEAPAVTPLETMAEAVPDTVKPTHSITLPQQKVLPAAVPELPQVQKKAIADQVALQENETLHEAATEVKVSPFFAKDAADTSAAKPKVIALRQKMAFAQDSNSVSKALEGKLAGVKLREANYVAMRELHGTVLSAAGQPLPGVAVQVKGTATGVATDAKGNFTLKLPKKETTLVFNYIGFNREEKAISANANNLTVNLSEKHNSLSEVVVVTDTKTSEYRGGEMVSAKPGVRKSAYRKYLRQNIRYSADAIKGRVVVLATVAPSGDLQNIRIGQSLCASCDKEAIRLVREGPGWKAAMQQGKPVAQEVSITVHFNP